MPRKPRVLIVDDNKSYQRVLEKILTAENFSVHTATDAQSCLQALDKHFYHAVMLQDSQGLAVLDKLEKEGRTKISKFFVLQESWSYGTVREQYRSHRYDKTIDEIITQETVVDAGASFFNYLRDIIGKIKLDIEIHYDAGSGSQQIVEHLLASKLPLRHTPDIASLTEEFELMLCDLLYVYDDVFLSSLSPGYSGAGVFLVNAFENARQTDIRLIKIGGYNELDREYQNFLQYVDRYLRGGRMANAVKFAGTAHFGGILYTFLGNEIGERLQEFGETYQQETDAANIISIIDKLIHDTCEIWYRNRMPPRLINLTDYYQRFLNFGSDSLKRSLDQLSNVRVSGEQIVFSNLHTHHELPNPLPIADEVVFQREASICYTHGDLNERNILVNGAGTSWLVDFRFTGDGHILRDIAALDTAIRINLLHQDDVDLNSRYQFEAALMSVTSYVDLHELAGKHPSNALPIVKAFESVVHLRRVAHQLTKDNPKSDIDEYYIALFYFTIRAIKFTESLSIVQREHALMSASLLAKRLSPSFNVSAV